MPMNAAHLAATPCPLRPGGGGGAHHLTTDPHHVYTTTPNRSQLPRTSQDCKSRVAECEVYWQFTKYIFPDRMIDVT